MKTLKQEAQGHGQTKVPFKQESKTLKQEDLSSLRDAYDTLSRKKDKLADLIVLKDKVDRDITQLIHDIPVSENNLSNVESRISKDYNAKSINMNTGEYTCNCLEASDVNKQ